MVAGGFYVAGERARDGVEVLLVSECLVKGRVKLLNVGDIR